MVYTSIVAFKYAKLNNDKIIMVTGIIGFLCACFFAALLLVPLPYFNISLSKESYFFLIIWILIGYYFYKNQTVSN